MRSNNNDLIHESTTIAAEVSDEYSSDDSVYSDDSDMEEERIIVESSVSASNKNAPATVVDTEFASRPIIVKARRNNNNGDVNKVEVKATESTPRQGSKKIDRSKVEASVLPVSALKQVRNYNNDSAADQDHTIATLRLANRALRSQLKEFSKAFDASLQAAHSRDRAAESFVTLGSKAVSIKKVEKLLASERQRHRHGILSKEKQLHTAYKKIDYYKKVNKSLKKKLSNDGGEGASVEFENVVNEQKEQIALMASEIRNLEIIQKRQAKEIAVHNAEMKELPVKLANMTEERRVLKNKIRKMRDLEKQGNRSNKSAHENMVKIMDKNKRLAEELSRFKKAASSGRGNNVVVVKKTAEVTKWEDERGKLEKQISTLERIRASEKVQVARILKAKNEEINKIKKQMDRYKQLLSEKEKEIRIQILEVKKVKRNLREIATVQLSRPVPNYWERGAGTQKNEMSGSDGIYFEAMDRNNDADHSTASTVTSAALKPHPPAERNSGTASLDLGGRKRENKSNPREGRIGAKKLTKKTQMGGDRELSVELKSKILAVETETKRLEAKNEAKILAAEYERRVAAENEAKRLLKQNTELENKRKLAEARQLEALAKIQAENERKNNEQKKLAAEEEAKRLAATVVQSSYRGHKERKKVKQMKLEQQHRSNKAATVVQSGYRGYKDREKVKRMKAEKDRKHNAALAAQKKAVAASKEINRPKSRPKSSTTKRAIKETVDDIEEEDKYDDSDFENEEPTIPVVPLLIPSKPTTSAVSVSTKKNAFSKPMMMSARIKKKEYI